MPMIEKKIACNFFCRVKLILNFVPGKFQVQYLFVPGKLVLGYILRSGGVTVMCLKCKFV